MTTIAIIIIGLFLILSISSARRAPVVIVRERNDSGFWVLLFVGVCLWLFFSAREPGCNPSPLPPPSEENKSSSQESEGDTLLIERHPHALTSNTHVNVTPPSTGIGFKQPDLPTQTIQRIVLVKRFADSGKAALLQRHFSQWGMRILEADDAESPYWNCVFIENEAEGRAKIREWNRHRQDFEHMGLELTLTRIEIH